MSKITKYIKRGIKYIMHGQPVEVVRPQIAILPPNQLLAGRTALVTGGTGGIGKAIVEAYLKAGADVVFTSRNQQRGDKVAKELSAKYPERFVFAVELDNMKVSSFNDIFQRILSRLQGKKLSILVNNAGVTEGWWCHTTEEEYDLVMNTNMKGVFFLTEIVARYMRDNGIHGNILNITSTASLRPANTAYRLSKWALKGFTLGLAKTLLPYDIIVNGIAPGPTATKMMGADGTNDFSKPKNPNGRLALPEEIANMAVIYVSSMARTIVGDVAYMSGGAGVLTVDDNNIFIMD